MNMILTIDGKDVQCYDIEISGIEHDDAPDYCDAYISSAFKKDENGSFIPLTEEEIDSILPSDVSDAVYEWIY